MITARSNRNRLRTGWRQSLIAFAAVLALGGCAWVHAQPRGAGQGRTVAGIEPLLTPPTALDAYAAAPDTNYNFHVVSSIPGKEQTTYILEMTSQAWLTTNEVDRPLWKHWLVVVRPKEVAHAQSLLFIGGGANNGAPPKGPAAT